MKDAVKVIPPSEEGTTSTTMVWDGSDVWMLPHNNMDGDVVGQSSPSSSRSAGEQLTAAARAEALMKS